MEYLKQEEILLERDENGSLLPVDLRLTLLDEKELIDKVEEGKVVTDEDGVTEKELVIIKKGPTIKVLPIPRGKWLRLLKMKGEEQDLLLCTEHVLEPKITEEDYKSSKPRFIGAIVHALTSLALDVTQEELKEVTKEEATEAEEEVLKKNLNGIRNEPSSSSTEMDTTTSPSPVLPTEK